MSVRVLIVDDHRLFAEALEAMFERDPRIEVVGIAGEGHSGVRLALERRPDVVLMDLSMPLMGGLQATREIRRQWPQACVLILSGSGTKQDIARSLAAGARGYVTKGNIGTELIEAVLECGVEERTA